MAFKAWMLKLLFGESGTITTIDSIACTGIAEIDGAIPEFFNQDSLASNG
jgi:hypothetical protein